MYLNKKQIAIILSVIVIFPLTTGIIVAIHFFLPPSGGLDNRKVIIICRANNFYVFMYIDADSGVIINGECFLDWNIYKPL